VAPLRDAPPGFLFVGGVMPSTHEPAAILRSRARELLSDVAYGTTKEFFRILVAASLTTILVAATRPEEQRSRGWVGRVKVLGAMALLICVLFLAFERVIEHCDTSMPLCGYVPGLPAPPPPPPPTPFHALKIASNSAVASAADYVRKHPFQLAAAAGSLFLADFLNLAIAIDKLDPVVRLVRVVSMPARRLLSWVQRHVLQFRAESLIGIPGRPL
jgi:hypothetical protein